MIEHRIFKYELLDRTNEVDMPAGAEVLTVQIQHDKICLWAKVDPTARTEKRVFVVYGTGHPIEDDSNLSYIGTVQMAGGTLVWHVFEKK